MERRNLDLALASPAMLAVLVAQFLSALGDNAILIVAIAVAKGEGHPQLIPWLQAAFLVPFVVLAPIAGPLADRFSKGRVMLATNLVKLVGAAAMAGGADSLAAYALVGVGATLYSPAKYGILAQMFPTQRLVRANSLLEGSTIAAILLGVTLGGWFADFSLAGAFGGVIGCYALAGLANLFIPRVEPENALAELSPRRVVPAFWSSLRGLLADADARFSLLGTSVFWGSGATLRVILFAWVPLVLQVTDNRTPAALMGVLSVGIVAGAALAAAWVPLARVNRALWGGCLLGPAVLTMTSIHGLAATGALMVFVGACGGLFIVPLNALLQQRGHASIGAGRALAVQNFFENCSMLGFDGAYLLAVRAAAPVIPTVGVFGLLLTLVLGAMALSRRRAPVASARS